MLKERPTIAKINNHKLETKQLSPNRTNLLCNKQANQIQANKKLSPSLSNRSIKIRLVSPLKSNINTDITKQSCTSRQQTTPNHSPNRHPYISMQYNSKLQQPKILVHYNDHSNVSIKQHLQQNPKYQKQPSSPTKKYQSFILMKQNDSLNRKQVSPKKICINNKQLEYGSLKSQIIYVAPFKHIYPIHRQTIKSPKTSDSNQTSILWRKQLIIQEENEAQSSKQSTHRSQLNQIQQLRQELEQSQKKIKQILNNTNKDNESICVSEFVYTQIRKVPKNQEQSQPQKINLQDIPLEYSRMETQNKIIMQRYNTQKTLINDLSFQTNQRLSIKKEQAQIQTDRIKYKKPAFNLSIIKTFQHKIDLINTKQSTPIIFQKQLAQAKLNKQLCLLTVNEELDKSTPIQKGKDISINTLQTFQLCFTEQETLCNKQVQSNTKKLYQDLIADCNQQYKDSCSLIEKDEPLIENDEPLVSSKINNSIYLL